MNDPPPPSTPDPPTPAIGRRLAWAFTSWFLIVILAPAAAFLVGNRVVNLEGSAPAPWPGWHLTSAFDTAHSAAVGEWLSRNQPLRDEAIRANALVDTMLLGDSTSPQVILGRDGWLFTSEDTKAACAEKVGPPDLRRIMERMNAQATKAHKDLTILISPDKSEVESEHLPAGFPLAGCVEDYDRRFRAAFTDPPTSLVPDLWAVVEWVKAVDGDAFYRTDSHLAPRATLEEVKALIEHLQPGLWDAAAVHDDGIRPRETDLSRVLGLPTTERDHYYEVRRPGVRVTPTLERLGPDRQPLPQSFVTYRATGGPVIPGRTVILHDSQFALASAHLVPWFEELELVHWNSWSDPRVEEALARADHIVIETVQRATQERFFTGAPDRFDAVFGPA